MPTAILKFGGEVVANPVQLLATLRDVAGLVDSGWRFLLCHGGNPQANALTSAIGLERTQVGGRRVTDAATLRVMKQVLAGEANVDTTAAAITAGLKAVGISGVSGPTVNAHRRPPKVMTGAGPDPVDFGYVGDLDPVDTALIEHLWSGGYTPVLNTLGLDADPAPGSEEVRPGVRPVYNINADTVSSAIAAALNADHLFLMTGVPGVLKDKDDPGTRIPTLTESQARAAIEDGTIVGGMIPKIEEALKNLARGVRAIHILGTAPGSLRAEAAEPGSSGTALLPG